MDHHTEKATQLLLEHREAHADPNSPLACKCPCSKFPKDGSFTYKEINHVMARIVEENGSVDLVNALLELGADVNNVRRRSSSLWKKVTRKNQQPERSDLLQVATVRCRPRLVAALAAKADQANLDNALHYAILRRDLDILKVLLDQGADPTELHDDFEKSMICSETELIRLLIAGPKRPCMDCLSAGLNMAVRNGASEILNLLVAAGADPNFGQGQALVSAVDSRNAEFLQTLTSGAVKPTAGTLDMALGLAYQKMSGGNDEVCIDMIQICILNGAQGDRTERLYTSGLVNCVKRRQMQLLELILAHERPVDPYHTLAVLEAIKSHQTQCLQRLLRLNPTNSCLVSALAQAMKVTDSEVMYEIVTLLLSLGASGRAVAEAFIECVRLVCANPENPDGFHMALSKLLLGQGRADVNYGKGEALRTAIAANLKEIIWDIIESRPSMSTLEAAMPVALRIHEPTQRLVVVEVLLQSGLRGPVVDRALVEAVSGAAGPAKMPLVELLLSTASVNHNEGEALVCAIRQQDFDCIRLILAQTPDRNALFAAAKAAMQLGKSERRETVRELIPRLQTEHLNLCLKQAVGGSKDVGLVELLLESGAEAGCENGACLKAAAVVFDLTVLRLLAEKTGQNERLFSGVLGDLFAQGDAWLSHSHMDTVELLLQYGASGTVVSKGLVDAMQGLVRGGRQYIPETLFDLLLAHGADVNYQDGEAVRLAAKQGDRHVLRKLLGNATRKTTTGALHASISAGHTEARLLELIDVFTESTTTTPNFNASLPGTLPPLHMCLQSYPRSTVLTSRLISAGCDLEQEVPCVVYGPSTEVKDLHSFGEEQVNALVWALLQPNSMVSSAVISELAEHGGNVSFTTPKSHATPLILAAKLGRPELVDKFLRLGAVASAQDALGRSALFYASSTPQSHQSVVLLLQKRLPVNDGSLHEASRNFHADVMEQLITAGHEPDFRSTKHGGHTALTEMASNGVVPHDDLARAEAAVDLLKRSGASPLAKVHGRTAIFVALDSKHAESITGLLLDRILWKTINDENNVFHDGDYHYSPTMYVQKGRFRGPPEQAAGLLALLRAQGAIDRFYAPIEHEQPPDAVGMPEEIRDFERERRARQLRLQREEEDHARALEREQEAALQKVTLRDRQRYADLDYDDAVSSQRRMNRGLDHNQDMQIETERHTSGQMMRVREAMATSTIDRLKHHDTEAMRLATREADLTHRVRERSIKGWEDHLEIETKSRRHASDLRQRAADSELEFRRAITSNNIDHRRERNKAELTAWSRDRSALTDALSAREKDKLDAGKEGRAVMAQWATHRMKMEEKGVETWLSSAPSGVLGEVREMPERRMISS